MLQEKVSLAVGSILGINILNLKIKRTYFSKREPKYYSKGIRASKPHELWHIDVTQVKTKSFQKLYLQLVVDNYSRAIIRFREGCEEYDAK